MKKITLLAALLVGAVSFSQQVIIDRLPDSTTGLISTLGDNGVGVYCADYFVLNNDTTLETITVPGFTNAPPLSIWIEGFNIFIYTNAGSAPSGNPEVTGSGVVEFSEIDPADYTLIEDGTTGQTTFQVDVTHVNGGTPITLPAGEYWISAFPNVIGGPTDAGRWNWYGSASSAPAIEPMLIDPSDLFGGATNWTNISSLIGDSFPSLAWQLTGAETIGIEDNLAESVSVYPNPATSVLNISLPSNIEVKNSSLIDMLGRTTGVVYSNGEMNISNLAPGVYFLNLETTAGSYTQKVVKQ